MSNIKDKILEDLSVYGMECYRDGKVQGRAEVIKEIHRDLITEIDLLNSTDMTDANLYKFAIKIKEITDKLKEQEIK